MKKTIVTMLLLLCFTATAFAGNVLYGTELWGNLVIVSTTNGATTIVGNTGQQYMDDMAFVDSGPFFYGVSYLPQGTRLLKIGMDGSTTVLNDISYNEIQGIAYKDGNLYADGTTLINPLRSQ